MNYYYTGWQHNVQPATSDIGRRPEVTPVADMYDEWAARMGNPLANHYIVTKYVDGKHSIGFHCDTPYSIKNGSLITIVKTGTCARPFELRRRVADKTQQMATRPFFSEVLQPGTAVIMTLEANLQTQHGVPPRGGGAPSPPPPPPPAFKKPVPPPE